MFLKCSWILHFKFHKKLCLYIFFMIHFLKLMPMGSSYKLFYDDAKTFVILFLLMFVFVISYYEIKRFQKTLKSIIVIFWILNFHFKNCWLPWECNFNKNTRFMSSRSSCKVSNANAKFQFIFWNTTGNFSFEAYRQLVLHFTIYTHTCTCHIKPSKLQKMGFSSLQDMRGS